MKNRQLPRFVFWLILIGLFAFTAKAQNSKTTSNTTKNQIDVYVVGISYDKNTNQHFATYWKNRQEVRLTDGRISNVEATSIAVVGNDVYVAGQVDKKALYWKNGQLIQLGKANSIVSCAESITIVGNDVYVAGWETEPRKETVSYEETIARYWKNGQPVSLPRKKDKDVATAFYISVIENDVYVIGRNWDYLLLYWKNGQRVEALNNVLQSVSSITKQGGQMYAVGAKDNTAAYWRNGKTEVLTNQISFAKYVAATGNDIYVAGIYDMNKNGYAEVTDGDGAIYWKNEKQLELSGPDHNYRPTSIAATGNDVYVTAYDRYHTGRLWKNNQLIELPNAYKINQVIIVEKAGSNSTKAATSTPVVEKKQVIAQTKVVEKIQPYITPPPSAKEKADQFLAENKKRPGVITTASGFQYQVLKEGTGAKPLATDRVKVHYRGTSINGNEFKSTDVHIIPKNSNPGWAEGIPLMRVGSKYKFFVPSKLTFIGPMSEILTREDPIILEVEVLGIEN